MRTISKIIRKKSKQTLSKQQNMCISVDEMNRNCGKNSHMSVLYLSLPLAPVEDTPLSTTVDSWPRRVEFQMRGIPHFHNLINTEETERTPQNEIIQDTDEYKELLFLLSLGVREY